MKQSTYRAERRTIYLGDIPLEIAMLPNGDYCLSQTQVAGAIDKGRDSMSYFYRSKYFKAISENGFDCGKYYREPMSIFFATKRLKARKHKRFDCPKS